MKYNLKNRPRYEPISNPKASTSERTYNAINTLTVLELHLEGFEKELRDMENPDCACKHLIKEILGEVK